MRALLVDCCPYLAPVSPTSLAGLAAVLRAEGHEATVLALNRDSRISPRGLAARLVELAPDLVGIALYQRNVFHARAFASLVRSVLPDVTVAVGGAQAAFLPEEALAAMPEVDAVVRGEGEVVLSELARRVASGASLEDLPGATIRRGDGTLLTTPLTEVPGDLSSYPSPWLSGVLDPGDWDEAVLLTSRGCGYGCAFCITPAMSGHRVRTRAVEEVVDETVWVAARGSGRLWFADPDFSSDPERVAAVLEGVLRRGATPAIWLEARADSLIPDLVSVFRRAGVHTVAMGLESAAPAVTSRLGKGLDPDLVGGRVAMLQAAGIDVELFSQYALPGEQVDDALATLAFVQRCGVRIRGNSNAQQMQLYFGAPITTRPEAHGISPLQRSRPPYLSVGTEYETAWMRRDEIGRVRAAWLAASEDGGQRLVS